MNIIHSINYILLGNIALLEFNPFKTMIMPSKVDRNANEKNRKEKRKTTETKWNLSDLSVYYTPVMKVAHIDTSGTGKIVPRALKLTWLSTCYSIATYSIHLEEN